jgi:hypothetical protein
LHFTILCRWKIWNEELLVYASFTLLCTHRAVLLHALFSRAWLIMASVRSSDVGKET